MQGILLHRSLLLSGRNHLPSRLSLRYISQAVVGTANEKPSYVTQPDPVYTLPHYGASDEQLDQLSDTSVTMSLKAYGGLIRRKHDLGQLREGLRKVTNAKHRPSLLTIEGVVVSDEMNKSVVVATRRKAYSTKLRNAYLKMRRFIAHDEFDLCREGDHVIIRPFRPLSKHKYHVVVQNYGDKTRSQGDLREESASVEF